MTFFVVFKWLCTDKIKSDEVLKKLSLYERQSSELEQRNQSLERHYKEASGLLKSEHDLALTYKENLLGYVDII